MPYRWLLVTAVATLLGLGAAQAADDPVSEIRAALEQWRLDFNAGRSAHICDLFSTDLRYDFRGLPEQTYPLLCARLHRALGDRTQRFQYDLRIKDIIVSGSLAAVRLTWTETLTVQGKGSVKQEQPGLDVFQRQLDGRWKIIRYLAYEDE